MAPKRIWRKASKLNKNGAITGVALIALVLTQIPGAIKNAAEIVCIGQTSNKIWRTEQNHSEANMIAVQNCNGLNR